MASTNTLRRVGSTPEELRKVAETLAAAFKDDAVINALVGKADQRLPSNVNINSFSTILKTGLYKLIWTVGWRGYKRVTGMGAKTDKVKARAGVKSTQYWYCFFVGVRHEYQGKGLSSLLMSPHVAHKSGPLAPSHNNLPAWLESTSIKSRNVYEHLGFELVETQIVAEGEVNEQGQTDPKGAGVKLYCMFKKA
ncbi:hypothetical protein OIV83_000899 [Microbotryomycetes sp. JL201]|nr:hypothetical protein OIV83_000899 [Microbotryomycetes sp. JL201]